MTVQELLTEVTSANAPIEKRRITNLERPQRSL